MPSTFAAEDQYLSQAYLPGGLNFGPPQGLSAHETDRSNLISQERFIMLLIDEINRSARLDTPENVFDLLKVVDSLANTTRGQLHVKQAQRSWENFRKRMRETYPKTYKHPSSSNDDQHQLPQEPDYINRLRNRLTGDQTLANSVKTRLPKRLVKYESHLDQSWGQKETKITNLVLEFKSSLMKGQLSMKNPELKSKLDESIKCQTSGEPSGVKPLLCKDQEIIQK